MLPNCDPRNGAQYLPPVFKAFPPPLPAPDHHFAAAPNCCVIDSSTGRVRGGRDCPSIRADVVSPTGVQIGRVTNSPPDDHFTPGPDRPVNISTGRGIGGAGGCPTIRGRMVCSAGVEIVAR